MVALCSIALGLSLVGCAATPAEPEPQQVETPVSYPVPDGCPSTGEMGLAFIDDPDFFEVIDASLLDSELTIALPAGGCGFARIDRANTDPGKAARTILVWYFNIGEPGKITRNQLVNWSRDAGGVPMVSTFGDVETTDESGLDFDLPIEFSGWTGATVAQKSGYLLTEDTIPEFTQGSTGTIIFTLDADRVAALVAASGNGDGSIDPTTALAQGLTASGRVELSVTDSEGYTFDAELSVKLDPYVSEIENSIPGEFDAVTRSNLSATITNTTGGRVARSPWFSVIAIYPDGSEFCTALGDLSDDAENETYCQVPLGVFYPVDLDVGGSQEVTSGLDAFTGGTDIRVSRLSEAGSSLATLNSPLSIYVRFGDTTRTSVNFEANKGCVARQSGASIVVPLNGWPDPLCG